MSELSKHLSKEQTQSMLLEMYTSSDDISIADIELFNQIVNVDPPKAWLKSHPFIKGYEYLPIDKVEWLMRKLFKDWRVEILREGTSFNGVYVVVRVHYYHPAKKQYVCQDGIGAEELQTKSGHNASDMGAINPRALSMAYPKAKTAAVKDACDHIGRIFGGDIGRKDILAHVADMDLISHSGLKNVFS